MMTEMQVRAAIAAGTVLKDFDGETGRAVDLDTDGETLAVRIEAEDFSRWTDALDLSPAGNEAAK